MMQCLVFLSLSKDIIHRIFFERWEKKFNDFVLTKSDGSKKFHLSVNVHGFEPEEIKIKTQNGLITISAKKKKKVK